MKKRLLCLALAALLFWVRPSAALAAKMAFQDVPSGSAFYASVQWAVQEGITKGTTATTFSPNATCTRQHILTFLWRASGCPTYSRQSPFSDISTDGDFGKAAQWAYTMGLEMGVSNPTDPTGKPLFQGFSACTRLDAVMYLFKLAGCPVVDMEKAYTFQDIDARARISAEAVAWAVEKGVTNGTSATTFSPDNLCTRGHIVTFLYRYQNVS